jgi:hypothetical protein
MTAGFVAAGPTAAGDATAADDVPEAVGRGSDAAADFRLG